MAQSPQSPYTSVREILKQADRGLETPPDAAKALLEIRRLAQDLDAHIDHAVRLAERRGSQPRAKTKRAKAVVGYSIKQGRYEISLAEHRKSGAPPYGCPRSMYDLIAEVIHESPASIRFNEVYEEVERRIGEDVPDYQVRVAMRFFAHVGVLEHSRARFKRDPQKSFSRLAKKAWDDLRRQTEAGQAPA